VSARLGAGSRDIQCIRLKKVAIRNSDKEFLKMTLQGGVGHLRAAQAELRNSVRLSFYDLAREYQLGARCPGVRKTAWGAKEPLFDDATKRSIADRRIRTRIVHNVRLHALVSNALSPMRLHSLFHAECRLHH
jgi:hypothetical protein